MKNILIFIIGICLLGCKPDYKKTFPDNQVNHIIPVIKDTIGIESFGYDRLNNISWLETADYRFLYIGKNKDTIYIHPFLSFIPAPPPPIFSNNSKVKTDSIFENYKAFETPFNKYYIERFNVNQYRNWQETKIEIFVDTNTRLSNSYATSIINKDVDSTYIGYGSQILMIMEAIDSTGKWRPIEKRFGYFCGTGLGLVILPPNEIIVTRAPIFKGDYETKLRLKLDNHYSNSFDGSIYYRQFERRFNGN
jgi:hypothetical protein